MVASVHGGAREILQPRALRTLKYKARTLDMTPSFGTFFRELEDKFGDATLAIPEDLDGRLDAGRYGIGQCASGPVPSY